MKGREIRKRLERKVRMLQKVKRLGVQDGKSLQIAMVEDELEIIRQQLEAIR